MSRPVRVRSFDERDASACRALWAELTRWHRGLYDDPSIGGEDPAAGFDEYRQEFPSTHLWVGERDGTVVAFAGLIARGRSAEIEPVIVAPAERRKGVGRLIVETVVGAARAQGIGQLKVRPVARNAEAIAFFAELGFNALGHVELLADFARPGGYWRPGERIAGLDFEV